MALYRMDPAKLQPKQIPSMECKQRSPLSYRMAFCRIDSVHGKQSKVALVTQNGILQYGPNGTAFQADPVHGMQSQVALAMQNGILQNGSSGAAIQIDSVHGMQSKVALAMQDGILQFRCCGAAIQADSAHGMQFKIAQLRPTTITHGGGAPSPSTQKRPTK